jgi:hypothetical protein
LIVATYDQGVRDELWKEQEELGRNFKVVTKEQVKFVDAPLTLAANSTANVPVIGVITSLFAGQGGSAATLASQLFGINYLIDSGNSEFNKDTIKGLNNGELMRAILNKDIFSFDKDQNGNKILIITDKEGNQKTYNYEINQKSLNDISLADLAINKDYALHGIYNNADEAFRNGIMQLGTLQNYDSKTDESSFISLAAPTKGLIVDGIENVYNFIFGTTPLASANVTELKEFSQTMGVVGQYQSVTIQDQLGSFNALQNPMINIRMAAHSNGGDRLYLGVLGGANSKDFEYIDFQGNKQSKLQVQFYGTPTNTNNIQNAAKNAGLINSNQIQNIINPNDYVGEGLGRNRGGALSSLAPIIYLYNAPKLFTKDSPHSNYYCQGSFCQFDKYR